MMSISSILHELKLMFLKSVCFDVSTLCVEEAWGYQAGVNAESHLSNNRLGSNSMVTSWRKISSLTAQLVLQHLFPLLLIVLPLSSDFPETRDCNITAEYLPLRYQLAAVFRAWVSLISVAKVSGKALTGGFHNYSFEMSSCSLRNKVALS